MVKSIPKERKQPKITSPPVIKFISNNLKLIVQFGVAVIGVMLSYLIWKSSFSGMRNLVNANSDELSAAFLGKMPYVFFCSRAGRQEGMPTVLSDLHGALGSKVGFAVVNCSQTLPSGKNMYQRFKLKKEWRPTVFITSPWSKPVQMLPASFKDLPTLRKAVDAVVTAKATEIEKDSQLTKLCAKAAGTHPCVVIVKGKKYSKDHAVMEENLVTRYPDIPVLSIKGYNKRLSFEDSSESPHDQFAMKLYAIRNNTHYLAMVFPLSTDNINTFVDRAIESPLQNYFTDNIPIKLAKPSSSQFKQRLPPQMPKAEPQPEPKTHKEKSKKSAQDPAENAKKEAEPELTPEQKREEELKRQQRERERREEMERQQQEYLFQEEELGSRESADDSEEELIEL
mmetsp:Transcript_24967/g.25183  ORF Transcript_24967/g.25183 Transcript_24967/m.25183 type:complete len:397 (-) Transcript_24967:82-1272(-)